MTIDKGNDGAENLILSGYVRTTTQGYIFTREGINWIATSIQELYNEVVQAQSASKSIKTKHSK